MIMIKLVPVSQQLSLTAVALSRAAQNPGAPEGWPRDQPGAEPEKTGIPGPRFGSDPRTSALISFIQSDSIRFCLKSKSTAEKCLGSRMFLESPHSTPWYLRAFATWPYSFVPFLPSLQLLSQKSVHPVTIPTHAQCRPPPLFFRLQASLPHYLPKAWSVPRAAHRWPRNALGRGAEGGAVQPL